MSFIIRNLTGSAVVIDDLGITIPASTDYDVVDLQPNDVAISVDLVNELSGSPASLAILSPLDGVTVLDSATGVIVVQSHNDPHWGIRGGLLDQLDDVDTTGANPNDVLQLNGSGTYVAVTPSSLIGDAILGDLGDVDDGTAHTAGTVYVFKGDGTNLDVVDFTADPDVTENIQDIVGAMGTNGTDTTFVYTDAAGTIQWNVDDVFLRNTGDTLDSGTLTIASGASINIATGGDLTITDPPVDPLDATNKEYVDSVAAGLDPKESSRVATLVDVGGVYSAVGGTAGTGGFTGSDAEIDGVTLVVGDRVLVKNQTDAKQNGIYQVTVVSGGSPATVDMERAPDQDGTPANEVSAGNYTFVEQGTQADTGWVLQGDGLVTLNTDDLNWVQFSASGSVDAGIGLSEAAGTIDLDISDLTNTAVVSGDSLAFHDLDGTPSASGSQTRNRTFSEIFADLNVVNNVTGTGIIVQTAADTYVTRAVAVDGAGPLDGLAITNGDGVAGNPTVGLDIQNLPTRPAVDGTDLVAVYDQAGNNVSYSVDDIAGALANVDSFKTWTGAGNTTGDASIVADSATDTATLTGGTGISIGLNDTAPASAGIVTYTFVRDGMADTAITSGDTFPFFDADGTTANEAEYRSFGNMITDLGLATAAFTTISGDTGSAVADTSTDTLNLTGAVNGGITTVASDTPETVTFGLTGVDLTTFAGTVATTDFIFMNDSADTAATLSTKVTWASVIADLGLTVGGVETVTAAGVGAADGLSVTGTATDPVVGLDIVGNALAGEDMAAGDTFIGYNLDGTANEAFTGQEIADGVATILAIPSSLAVTSIGPLEPQQILTLEDTTRANKILSIETTTIVFSENRIGNNDWVQVGNATDALSGYIVPMNATIVRASMTTSNANGNTKSIDLYIDGVNNGALLSVTGAGEQTDRDNLLNIDVAQDAKLRLRGGTGGNIEDTVITIWFKYRG